MNGPALCSTFVQLRREKETWFGLVSVADLTQKTVVLCVACGQGFLETTTTASFIFRHVLQILSQPRPAKLISGSLDCLRIDIHCFGLNFDNLESANRDEILACSQIKGQIVTAE